MERKVVNALYSEGRLYIKDLAEGGPLLERGYGESVKGKRRIDLDPYEALHLINEKWITVEDAKTKTPYTFTSLLAELRKRDRRIWAKYLVYRDLRARGYVVKAGFGLGVDFRVYERGFFGKDPAKLLVYSVFEGEPLPVSELVEALGYAQNIKKDMILGVIERRGEIVYYSLSEFTL